MKSQYRDPRKHALRQTGPRRRHTDFCMVEGRWVNEEDMRRRLAALRIEHRDLDAAIGALTASGSSDQLQIARLKRRKLLLRDQIAILEDFLTPDIIA